MAAVPPIYQYLDYRRYLREWFDAKKLANPRFSHRAFVRRTGQKSPSFLKDVMEGRRNLTATTTEEVCHAMRLTAAESAFFTAMVQLDQASTAAERNDAWNTIAATRRFREARGVEGDGFEYLSHWFYPAIYELARTEGFRADPAWVAARLRPRLTVKEARDALDALQRLGLLVAGKGDDLIAVDESVVTPHEVRGLAVHNYHYGMLDRARESIDGFKAKERHFLGVTVAVPASLLPRLKRELNQVQERLLDLCDSAEEPRDAVLQIQLAVFPLAPAEESG